MTTIHVAGEEVAMLRLRVGAARRTLDNASSISDAVDALTDLDAAYSKLDALHDRVLAAGNAPRLFDAGRSLRAVKP